MPSKQTKTWWMMSTFCKPVISNSAWPWRHPSLLYIIALDMKTLEVPKCTQHYYTWHESSWRSVILLLHQNCTSLDNSAYNNCQWLIRIQKNQWYSTQLPDMPRQELWGYESICHSPLRHRLMILTEGCCTFSPTSQVHWHKLLTWIQSFSNYSIHSKNSENLESNISTAWSGSIHHIPKVCLSTT